MEINFTNLSNLSRIKYLKCNVPNLIEIANANAFRVRSVSGKSTNDMVFVWHASCYVQ